MEQIETLRNEKDKYAKEVVSLKAKLTKAKEVSGLVLLGRGEETMLNLIWIRR